MKLDPINPAPPVIKRDLFIGSIRKRPVVLSITHKYHGFHRQSEMRE
jgi:hypothetical protein